MLIRLIGEYIVIPKSKDICPIVREEVYSLLTDFFTKQKYVERISTYENENDETEEIQRLILYAMIDEDKATRVKGIELAETFLRSNTKGKKNEKSEFYQNILKLALRSLVSNTDILPIVKYLSESCIGLFKAEHFSILKKFIFHSNTIVSKTCLEILANCGKIKFSKLTPEAPSSVEITDNFKLLLTFLDDS